MHQPTGCFNTNPLPSVVDLTNNVIQRVCGLSITVATTLFVCLFVYLFNRSLRVETHLGPDGTRLKQNAQARLKSLYKHAGQLVYRNVKREKQIWRYEMKGKKTMATPNKSSWTILISAFGTRERRFFIQSQLPLRLFNPFKNHTPYVEDFSKKLS